MSSPNHLWTPGQLLLGDFEVQRKLGEGGMGAVYLVQSRSTKERFAVKRTHVRDPLSQANFLAELQTWIDLPENPHLAACRFFRTIDDEIVIFADFVEGGSLADWIHDGRLTRLDQILDVAIQTAWGLHAAHELGLVHQDVKPGNFLLTPDGVAKVSDFGLSRARAAAGERPPDETQKMSFNGETQLMGAGPRAPQPKGGSFLVSCGGMTPAYRSPEQAAGHKLSRQTDIWSWGLSVLEMFNGEVTWMDGQAAPDILAAYLALGPSKPDLPPMPAGVARVLERSFRIHPEERWPSLGEAAEALRGVYAEVVGQPYPRETPAAIARVTLEHAPAEDRPRKFLAQALQLVGHDPRQAEALLPPRASSRRAQAVADIATYAQAAGLYERLVSAGRADLIPTIASLYHYKARCHELAKDLPGALESRRRAIEWLERVDRDSELTAFLAEGYANLGHVLGLQRDFQAAIRAYDRAVALYEAAVGLAGSEEEAERLSMGLADSLALVYINKAGALSSLTDHREALALYDQAKTILLHLVKERDTPELNDLLASAHMGEADELQDLGRSRHAGYAYDEAIKIRERLVDEHGLGPFGDHLSRAYLNKAGMLMRLKQPREAADLYVKAIALRERLVYEEGHREMLDGLARVLGFQAAAMSDLKDYDAARALWDRSLAAWEQLVYREGQGELSQSLAMAYVSKGSFLCELKDYPAAVAQFDRGIAILERLVDEEGRTDCAPDLSGAIMNKCHALKLLNDYASALALFDRVIPPWEKLVAQGHRELAPELAKAYDNKAGIAEFSGDLPAAMALADKAVDFYHRLITEDGWVDLRPDFAGALFKRAAIRDKMGKHAEAVVELDAAIEILEKEIERRDSPKARDLLEMARSMRETIYWLYQLKQEDATKPGGAVEQLLDRLAAEQDTPSDKQ